MSRNLATFGLWKRLVLLLLALFPRVSHAEESTSSPWIVRTWQKSDGLPHNNLLSIEQAPDGHLWLACPAGLTRFDGIEFQPFRCPELGKTLAQMDRILSAHDGTIWLIGNETPLIHVTPRGIQIYRDGLVEMRPTKMVQDHEGAIWISYAGDTVCRFKDGKVTGFNKTNGLSKDGMPVICSDRDGKIWLASGGKLCVFRDNQFCPVASVAKLGTCLAPSADGGIWICAGLEILKLTPAGELQKRGLLPARNDFTRATDMVEDHDGAVWIGTHFSGLFRFAHESFEHVIVSSQRISSLFEDREGSLWVGTGGGGLNCVRARDITVEQMQDRGQFDSVQSLAEGPDGRLWGVAKDGLLVQRNPNGWAVVPETGETIRPINRIAIDPAGAVWMGTLHYSLHRLFRGELKTWQKKEGFLSHSVTALYASRAGEIWAGGETPTKLYRYKADQLQALATPKRPLRSIVESENGDVWIGGDGRILLRASGDDLHDESQLLPSGFSVRCLYFTKDGTLWAGGLSKGLVRIKAGRSTLLTRHEGLYDDQIYQIVGDDHGALWFGGPAGIFKAKQCDLNDVADGKSQWVQATHYSRTYGLGNLRTTAPDADSAIRTRDGLLWMPMGTALAVIDPVKVRDQMEPLPVLLKSVSVDDRAIATYSGDIGVASDRKGLTAPVQLTHDHHRIEIDFSALCLAAPENVRFRYQMKGFDQHWIETAERHAIYSRLTPGSYEFQVTAANNTDIWNPVAAGLTFIVTPSVWQRPWFQITELCFLLLMVAGIVRYVSFRRLRLKLQLAQQQLMVDKERSRIARDLHDHLGASLTEVMLFLQLAWRDREKPGQLGEHVKQCLDTARDVAQSLDEAVWAINPRNDTLPHLLSYIAESAGEFLRVANIRCRSAFPPHPPAVIITAEVRHTLVLALKEVLNNIVRHSGATEVWIRCTFEEDRLSFLVSDNGHGFEKPPENAYADGLRNLRHRLSEIGGECRIESAPGSGTEVEMKVSLPKQRSPA